MEQQFIKCNCLRTDQHIITTISDTFITYLHIFTHWETKWLLIQVTRFELQEPFSDQPTSVVDLFLLKQ